MTSHDVVFFRRHREDDPGEAAPGRQFLNACRLDYDAKDQPKPLLVVICGLDEAFLPQRARFGLLDFECARTANV